MTSECRPCRCRTRTRRQRSVGDGMPCGRVVVRRPTDTSTSFGGARLVGVRSIRIARSSRVSSTPILRIGVFGFLADRSVSAGHVASPLTEAAGQREVQKVLDTISEAA